MTLLTADEFREHVTTALGDDAIERALDAAEEAIDAIAGPVGAVTEIRNGGYTFVTLARRASAITSIVETWGDETTTLAAGDYQIRSDGRSLKRLDTGDNPSRYWVGQVAVEYTPEADEATRKMVQLQLAKLELAFSPGLASQTIGAWTEQYRQDRPYEQQRADILATLIPADWGFA